MNKKNFFIQNLKTYLCATEITKEQLAKTLGLSGQAVGKWFIVNRAPPQPTQMVLSGIIGYPVEDLNNKDLTIDIILKTRDYEGVLTVGEDGVIYSHKKASKSLLDHLYKVREQLQNLAKENDLAISELE
jgi:hypothetical protein